MSDLRDPDQLATRLAEVLSPLLGAVRVDGLGRLTGGASRETWGLDAVAEDGMHHELVLRRDPPGRPSAPGAIAREAAAMRLAAAAGVPVPRVLMDSEDPEVLGSAGMVMQRVVGEASPRRLLRDDRFDGVRPRLVGQFAAALAALHSADADALAPPLEQDPLDVLRATIDAVGIPVPTFEDALVRLDRERPAPTGRAVVHGDFRLGNLMVVDTGLSSVLDWELVHVGDPAEDLGWLCAPAWRFGSPSPVAGLGGREELLAAYRDAGGVEVPTETLAWWETVATLRWGVICLVQTSVHLAGLQRSVELAAIGRRVAETEWDLLGALRPDAAREAWAAVGEDSPTASEAGGGLHGRPTATELVDAVREFLDDVLRPEVEAAGVARRTAFEARVASNVLGVVARQLAAGRAAEDRRAADLADLGVADEGELADAVRAGLLEHRDDELGRVLATGVVDRLRVANPSYVP